MSILKTIGRIKINPWVTLLVLALFVVPFAVGPYAQRTLVADLSTHEVEITTGFSGDQVLMFGATPDEGDVVAVIRGPNSDVLVREKERTFGVWLNRESTIVQGVPSFYAIASNRPIRLIINEDERERFQIGIDKINLRSSEGLLLPSDPVRQAVIRNMVEQGRFSDVPRRMRFVAENLFRVTLAFPDNLPVGTYALSVYLVQGGEVVRERPISFRVNKVGFGAAVFRLAHNHGLLYGIFAVILAVGLGWFASWMFRRV